MDALIEELIKLAFAEDVGAGDVTTLCCVPPEARGTARLIIREDGVLAGVGMARRIFDLSGQDLRMDVYMEDGSDVKKGDVAFTVEGNIRSLLQSERIVLNVMQRMSGIATTTRRYVREIKDTGARVLDTRKTMPGMRLMDKEAVRLGGGVNHRVGLFDMILLKDNHIDFAGGIANAVSCARSYLATHKLKMNIEIEVRSLDELDQVMAVGGVDRIMLDNFSVADTRTAVRKIGGRYETESSGGITLENIRTYAVTGVDYISVGALTHSVKGLDMSLKAVCNEGRHSK
ncbi:MAG: carboxylating nicotinate-nucleotide diphosphorylase [Tannerellaceae bacterium]|jgi:nicotinate-nucleotide pyrophosphorylase (carboxylating)|nr:carboxylating nicotinate-nucleotide diphosphorylase [Tannerellaceae bacterium]